MDFQPIALPIALPLLAVAVLMCMRRAGETARHAINIVSCAAQLAAAVAIQARVSAEGVQVLRSGSWPAPFGNTLAAELVASAMVLVTAVIGLGCAFYAAGYGTGKFRGYFAPLYQALLLGVNGSFLTGDLFNLYVWFEVM
ncbi:MAG TPA: hypothetical protein VLO11_08775, partial [Luteolibacter sp.]|nr:hypothetical protein [Luteolibacter sp.]